MSSGCCSLINNALSSINKCDTRVREITTEAFHEIIHGLETFDIVLTSSVGLMSFVIQYGTRSRFTHVGLIVRGHPFCNNPDRGVQYPVICNRDCLNQVAVWESNIYDYHTDIKYGRKTSGTHLIMLGEMVSQRYIKSYAFRKMINVRYHPTIQRNRIKFLYKFIEMNYDKKYDKNWMNALLKYGTSPFTRERYFCSSLVAATLFYCGIFRYSIGPELGNPAEFSPSSFEAGSKLPVYDVSFSPILFYGSPVDASLIQSKNFLKESTKSNNSNNNNNNNKRMVYNLPSSSSTLRHTNDENLDDDGCASSLPECPKIFTPKIRPFDVQ